MRKWLRERGRRRHMDLRNGETYESREAAEREGVPASDVAEVRPSAVPGFVPQIRVTKGPFKGRVYVRNAAGQLVRVDRERPRGR
jgi:hypothetical protein